MDTDQPTGDQIIDALERLGFEVIKKSGSRALLSKVNNNVAVPKGEIPNTTQQALAEKLRSVFAEYENVPLAKPIERIKDWAEETSH